MVQRARISWACALLLVAGCTVGPEYRRPPDDVPAAFATTPGREPVLATTPWWLGFNDATLTGLVDRARANSPELGQARALVAEARAALAQAEAGGAPQLTAGAGGSYGRSYTPPATYGRSMGYATANFDASWELDLWGRTRRATEAAAAQADAAQADADDAMLTLLGDLARSYVALRGIQAQLATTAAAIDNQRRANALVDRRFDGGDGTKLEAQQGRTLLLQQQSLLPVLQSQAHVLVNALSTLCGEPPDTLTALLDAPGPPPIPTAPEPAAGIPADLLRRRPDVRAAERQLAAAIAQIGAALAERYPSLRLSGSLSFSGSAAASLLSLPLFALGPTLKLPLLDGGQRAALVDIRRAQAEQARFGYRIAVLRALREVEDAMARLRGETLHRDQLRLTVASAQAVVDTARSLYTLGATDFLQVLDAQKTLNLSRDALVQAEAARSIQLVALFKALGGGWQAAAP